MKTFQCKRCAKYYPLECGNKAGWCWPCVNALTSGASSELRPSGGSKWEDDGVYLEPYERDEEQWL